MGFRTYREIDLAPWGLAALQHDVIKELSPNMQIYCSNARPLSIPSPLRGKRPVLISALNQISRFVWPHKICNFTLRFLVLYFSDTTTTTTNTWCLPALHQIDTVEEFHNENL